MDLELMTDPQAMASPAPRLRSRGFMLVSVIWISGLLAAFAVAVSVSVRSHALHARNAMSEVLAAGIADGIARLTALRAAQGGDARRADGRWQSCRWADEAEAWVSVQDHSGLVDLNTASPALMRALLEGLAMAPAQAAEMAGTMQDYRDGDRVSGLGGTEPRFYPGRSFGPKNAPFEAVAELDQLPGMTHELLARLRALTTVSNLQSGIDFATAPAELLQALGLSRASVAGLSYASPRASRVLSIAVAVRANDGTRFVRQAMIERTDQPARPFVIMSWEAGDWPAAALPDGTAASCLGAGGLSGSGQS